jgi:glycosyltransferase involved in cell wall biosynthesis
MNPPGASMKTEERPRLRPVERQPLKIACHAGQLLQPVPGGIGRYTHSLLRTLPAAGAQVVAFAAGARPGGVPRRVPWIDLGPPHGSVRYECWHRLRRPWVNLEADVIHAPSLAVPPVRDATLVVTVHDIAFQRVPDVTTRRGVSFHRRALAMARRHADLVIAPSSFTRMELIREGFTPEDVYIARLGIDRPLPREVSEIDAVVAGMGIDTPYVLTVGTIEPRTDLPTIVDAVGRIRSRQGSDIQLVVVGPSGWGQVQGLDRSFVRVLGEQPWSVVDALLRRAGACCIASRYEGFGLPALEALARGAPLAVADGSALEEVVGNAALLFAAGDVEGCTDALQRLLGDRELRDELAALGRARAEELTWAHSAEAHVEAYERAVALRARRG